MKRIFTLLAGGLVSAAAVIPGYACTGIALTAKDGSRVVARTTEWGASVLNCNYVVVPRGHRYQSFTPTGVNGVEYTSKYGYVGICTELDEFVVEGMNETGLSAGLFFFPGYGEYAEYNPQHNCRTLSDMQFVSWVLSCFSSIDEVVGALSDIELVTLHNAIGSVHWRISEPSGRMVVLEVVGGVPHFYENKLGVLTNSPGFEWQMTNLNNYINIYPGTVSGYELMDGVGLRSFGAGTGMLGIPGDVTPPSRFVRAAFYAASAPQQNTGHQTVIQSFQILNNFDIPVGVEHPKGESPEGMLSATQWTTASDQKALCFYYKTGWNQTIRCIDLKSVNFGKTSYQSHPLDEVKEQPVQMLKIR